VGISADAPVVGHIGGFRKQKNHAFLLRVARSVLGNRPNAVFLLIGDGNLRSQIEQRVRNAGMARSFVFAGERSDIPTMLSAMDAFLFPSIYECLPRALLEAQAAGLPCVASSAISREAASQSGIVRFLSLDADVECWSASVLDALRIGRSLVNGQESVMEFKSRGLSIQQNAVALTTLYEHIHQNNEIASHR
jgi:glycosyltransferase involved in cell wall biosynthesis